MGEYIRLVELVKYGRTKYSINQYKCQCGELYIRHESNEIRSNKSHGVGIFNKCSKESNRRNNTKYNQNQKYMLTIYRTMVGRCYNKNVYSYKDYGGIGITICDDWMGKNGFNEFYNWCMLNNYTKGMSIERKNVFDGYSPTNCRVIPMIQQATNKRNTLWFSYLSHYYPVRLVCNLLGLNSQSIMVTCRRKNIEPFELIISKVGVERFLSSLYSFLFLPQLVLDSALL